MISDDFDRVVRPEKLQNEISKSDRAEPGMGLQNEIAEWANASFGGKDDHQRFTKLQNEVAELGRLSVNNRDGVKDECADIMHLLFQYAYWYRFDLLEATRDKFETNKARAWSKQSDGTFQHVAQAGAEPPTIVVPNGQVLPAFLVDMKARADLIAAIGELLDNYPGSIITNRMATKIVVLMESMSKAGAKPG